MAQRPAAWNGFAVSGAEQLLVKNPASGTADWPEPCRKRNGVGDPSGQRTVYILPKLLPGLPPAVAESEGAPRSAMHCIPPPQLVRNRPPGNANHHCSRISGDLMAQRCEGWRRAGPMDGHSVCAEGLSQCHCRRVFCPWRGCRFSYRPERRGIRSPAAKLGAPGQGLDIFAKNRKCSASGWSAPFDLSAYGRPHCPRQNTIQD